MGETTRNVTIPIRLAISFMLIFLLIKNINRLQRVKIMHWFILFCLFYFYRLFVDYLSMEHYYMSVSQVSLYFLSFAVIPFVVISTQVIDKSKLKVIFNSILVGGLLFSIMVVLFYSRFIGQVGRLATGTVGESVISPLALAYSSTLVIGIFIFYLLYNTTSFYKKILMYIGIGLATIPFFLGASRGALIALGIPFILYFFSSKSVSFKVKSLFLLTVVTAVIIFLDQYLNSNLLDRFLGISEGVESESDVNSRIYIWKTGFQQFIENPILGSQLRVEGIDSYVHNIFIEVLHTTGLLGFIPFLIIMFKGWKISFNILKYHKPYFWLAVIYIQTFCQNMFSGSIYSSSWLWSSLAILIAFDIFSKSDQYQYRSSK